MAIENLTDIEVKNLKPGTAPYKKSDGGGLHVLVTAGGSKLWQLAYRFDGKQKTLALGVYPVVTLAMAREKRLVAKRQLDAKIDPGQARKEAAEAAREVRKTFEDAADGWSKLIEKQGPSEKTRDRNQRMIRYLTRAFGKKPIEEVKQKHLVAVLDGFEEVGSYETRMRLQSTALNIAGFAQGKAWIEENPFLGFKFGKSYTAPEQIPRPAIIGTEDGKTGIIDTKPVGQLLRDVATYQGRNGNLISKALELVALTFVRPGTVTQAEWDEFDVDGALWTIPFKKLKQRTFRKNIPELADKPHYVPLARQTVALLRALHKQTGNGRYLFPGRPGRSISANSLQNALNSLGYKTIHCPHGFRTTASTLLNAERRTVEGIELQCFHEQAIEFQLEHVDADTAEIYNRGQRLLERTKMMQFWADKIDTMRDSGIADPIDTSGGNVVRLARKQA